MTDGELVRQTIQGDRAAAEVLARRWSGRVLAFCHARVGNRHTAEDLAQETLLRGLRGLASIESPERFGTWLHGIAVHLCLDWHKAKQTSQVPFTSLSADSWPEELAMSGEATPDAVDDEDHSHWLLRQVESLSLEHREALLLYYYNDVTYRELAELLGVSAATINARLTQARAILRKRLANTPEVLR